MNDILNKLHEAAASPRAQMDGYLAQGKRSSCALLFTLPRSLSTPWASCLWARGAAMWR